MREDAAEQYLVYKLIDSNQDWEGEVVLRHEPPPRLAEAEREAAQTSGLVEHGADDAGGDPAPRAVGTHQGAQRSRAEGRARGLQLYEAQGAATDVPRHPGFEYTGEDDTSRMTGCEVDDDDIIDRLTRIFKDMPPYTACLVQEYSAARPPKEVGSRTP
jgi:hypothetical protein